MTSTAKPVLTGGCQCGAVRFALSAAPVKVSICHCRMCQKASGAPFASIRGHRARQFRLDQGQARYIPLVLDRRARFLPRLRHPAELPSDRWSADRDHDRSVRPPRPGGASNMEPNPGSDGLSVSPTCRARPRCRISGRKSSAASSATSIPTMTESSAPRSRPCYSGSP